jgi:hypothetical protein
VTRLLNGTLVTLCVVLAAELWLGLRGSRAPERPKTPLDHVRAAINGSYHDCVPLGWYPEHLPSGRFYPSVNLDVAENNGPFQALWVGIVPPGADRKPRVAAVKTVMDDLVDSGLLVRSADVRGERYNVTRYGQRFYYDGNALNGNVEDWPYLCYSRLRVTNLSWDPRYPDVPGPARSVAKHVRVWFETETTGDWESPFLRAHSVQLLPAASPADATVCRYVDGEWMLISVEGDRPPPSATPGTTSRERTRSGAGTTSARPKSWAPC